jgi:hypothetical protein
MSTNRRFSCVGDRGEGSARRVVSAGPSGGAVRTWTEHRVALLLKGSDPNFTINVF